MTRRLVFAFAIAAASFLSAEAARAAGGRTVVRAGAAAAALPAGAAAVPRGLEAPSLFEALPEAIRPPSPPGFSLPDGPALGAADAAPRAPSALALPDSRNPVGAVDELRSVGILSVDLKDSTKLFREKGVRAGYRAASAYLDFASEVARKHGGAVVRHTGDGGVFLFDGARPAFEAAIELQSRVHALRESLGGPPLAFHAGVHGGRVIVHRRPEGTDAYGQALERALALLDRSEGDDIAFSEGVDGAAGVAGALRGMPVLRGPGYRLLKPDPARAGAYPDALPGAQPPLARRTAEIRSTMFAALENWNSTYDEFGRRDSYATIRAFQEYMRRIAAAHGGSMVKSEGEGVMLSFPSAGGALRAAAEMQREVATLREAAPLGRRVAIRIGLSYGRTLREDTLDGVDYFGNTVNAAARLMKRASGGEIVVSARVARDPEAAAILGNAAVKSESLTLKGFKKPVKVFRVEPESVETGTAGPDLAARLAKVVRRTLERIRRLREPRE